MVYDKDESGHAPDQPHLFEKSWLIAKLPMKCCRTDKRIEFWDEWEGTDRNKGQVVINGHPFSSLRMAHFWMG